MNLLQAPRDEYAPNMPKSRPKVRLVRARYLFGRMPAWPPCRQGAPTMADACPTSVPRTRAFPSCQRGGRRSLLTHAELHPIPPSLSGVARTLLDAATMDAADELRGHCSTHPSSSLCLSHAPWLLRRCAPLLLACGSLLLPPSNHHRRAVPVASTRS